MTTTQHKIKRRASTLLDEAFLRQLYNSTRADEMALVPWSAVQKEAFLASQFNAQKTHYASTFPNSQHDIVESGGVRCGRLWIDRSKQTIHIVDITIHPDFRNKGIGAQLMSELIELSVKTNIPISLNVWQANVAAQRFYKRHNFVFVSEQNGYLLMERHP